MRRREQWNPLLRTYPDSEKINRCSEGAEILYVRLIAQSDDAGRYFGEPGWILAKLFTARQVAGQLDASEIERRLAELERERLITRYQVGDQRYLQILDVFKTSRKDVKPYLQYPEPCDAVEPGTARTRNESVTDAARECDGADTDSDENGPLERQIEPEQDLTLRKTTTQQRQTSAPAPSARKAAAGSSLSPATTSVAIKGIEGREPDWEAVRAMANRVRKQLGLPHKLSNDDAEIVLKVCTLVDLTAIAEHELWASVESVVSRFGSNSPPDISRGGYWHGVVKCMLNERGVNFNGMLKRVDVSHLMPAKPPPAAV